MEDLVVTYEDWDRLRSMANGLQVIAHELAKSDAELRRTNPGTTRGQLVEMTQTFVRMVAGALDKLSPAWAARFETESGVSRRRPNTRELLFNLGCIPDGTEVMLDPKRLPPGGDAAAREFRAVVTDRGRAVRWNGQSLSLSALTALLRDQYQANVNRGNVNGYKYWVLASDPSRTLWDLAEEVSRHG